MRMMLISISKVLGWQWMQTQLCFTWFLRSGGVRENQSTRMPKLKKMQKKFWTVVRRLRTLVQNFFLLASLANYLRFKICFTALVSSVIVSNWKPTLVFCVNKLVGGKQFILSWKVRENEFCRVVGTMVLWAQGQSSCAYCCYFSGS